ncbi:hypothetical protein [Brucella anthropi]|uniref:hypothetical protein n=1 Tax=Brucella anthropi TaxID=529 RepID=UPI00124C20C9|nr:hypothetical protein [Brucella anthropi]KAB2725660.1 hypothetical protein F9K76_12815 [Brucella anthropi]KAB2742971.1 hypothetical protein F9K74_12760 [Brucella anthropi]KAB2803792.1 hypothetical protein F9K83_12760 [Brucella anthropi]
MRTRSVFDSFTVGKRMTFGMDPYDKEKHCEIARTGPVELGILSIRIRDPRPQLRVFGAMASKDVFIGLMWKERNAIADKFRQNVKNSKKEWDRLFPHHSPIVSENADEYFSNHFLV